MKKCIAFGCIAGTRNAWVRCVRRAERGAHLCRRHGDAVKGAVLGMCVAGMVPDGVGQPSNNREDSPGNIAGKESVGEEKHAG